MFSTKKADIDRHVEECLKRINNETERNLRCLSFAKQYFKIERYEESKRYVLTYLSARPNSAEAHCLLGKCLEMLGQKEAARQAYTTSLRLDPKQNNLVFKVCELLASNDVEMDHSGAKHFCELAQSYDPTNPAIFNLKQRIVTAQSDDPQDVTNLILKELEARPTDVKLRVRLLKHLVQNNLVKEAYKHASEIEAKDLTIFHNNVSWYEAVAEVLVRYQRNASLPNSLGWEFWFLSVSILDKLVSLTLDEHTENIKTTTEYISALFNFDQTLAKAVINISDCPDRHLVQEFLNHYSAQLYFHLATLVFKQAQKDLIKFKEASNITLPLLFASYHSQPPDLQSIWFNHAPEPSRILMRRWRKEAAFRCSQVGHILQAAAKERKSILIEKATQYSMGMWREQLYKKLFVTRDQQLKMKTSYFLTNQQLLEIVLRLPESSDLLKFDAEAQLIFPDSLHHHIWIALNNKLSDLRCTVFDGLQYSVKNLKNCGAETLNVLDIDAFIYCATLCVKYNLENMRLIAYYNVDKPTVLPAAVTQELGTLNQAQFFKAAYRMYRNEYDSAFDQLRLILVDGIKTLRCVDSGLDVKLLVNLARIFEDRSKNATKQSEIEANEARAELYWKSALPILEKMKNNQAVNYPPNKLFNYKSKDMPLSQICSYVETGKLFSGSQLMKKKEYEKALRILETLKDPYASFYQAQIYKHMADLQTSQNRESVTSEMRSQNIILLSRARDCLYLTLDRLREPSVDPKHSLNEQLGTEIEKIERLLSRIDPDCTNRNECDGMSDENVSSADSTGDHYVTGYSAHNSTYYNGLFNRGESHNLHSTPYRSDLFKREAKPSPERLDAQLRQLTASKDAAINHILEHNKLMVDSHRTLVEELKCFKDAVNNLTSTVEDLKSVKHGYEELKDIKKSVSELKASTDDSFKNITDMVYAMKKEIGELKKDVNKTSQLSEEDIYGLANDYGADYNNINSNLAAYNTNLYPNYQARIQGAASLYGPPALYPGMYPPMPYYGPLGLPQTPGALQFGADQQLPGISGQDFRTISAALSQVQPTITYGQPLTQTSVPQPVNLLTGSGLTQTPNQSALFRDPKIGATPQIVFSSVTTPVVSSAPVVKAPPVNVVITSSDPLPSTKTPTSQQILSVTIPAQHLKGNVPKPQPHNYQIPLPTSTVPSPSPSVLSKPPPAVSTHSLLSNVAPPVYSAVSDKTPKNVSLGLQIEKSLEQTFNSSKNESANKSNISTSSVEEHDPCPDFKPIIPLPDEVPVTTGEENEIVLFCERAKLFRYASESKEWRERGVGVLKILKNPQTNKVRILMRRDQVLKICANHFLTKDMTLQKMPNSIKDFMWAAHDYADEEVVLEKLCVRFKSLKEAREFYDAFENAKDGLEESPVKEVKEKSKAEDLEPVTPKTLGGFVFSSQPNFKPKQNAAVPVVAAVESPKSSPFATFSFGSPVKSANQFPTFQANFTPVQKQNESAPNSVLSPASIKPQRISSGEETVEDFVPTAEFKPVVPLPELIEIKTGEENCEVLFESWAKLLRFDTSGDTKEWKEKGAGTMKLIKDKTVRLVMRRDQVLKVCCNHQLLKNMEFKKFNNNGKALTWCAKDFSEGVFKPETLCLRFKTEELANGFLKAVTSAQESLDENSCVVSKSEEHPEKHLKMGSPDKAPAVGFGDSFKPVKGSWDCKNCYVINEGKANYCMACDTPKNETLPKKSTDSSSGAAFSFGVPNIGAVTNSWGSAFKPKEGTWECKTCYIRNDAAKTHCISCEMPKDDTVSKKSTEKGVNLDTGGLKFSFGIPAAKPTISTEQNRPPIGWGDLYKPQEGTWECSQCLIRNPREVLHCQACEMPKDDTVPKKETKQGINLNTCGQTYTFGFPPASTGSKATFTFGQSSVSAFGAQLAEPATATPTEADTPFVFKPAAPVEDKEASTSEKFVFGSPQKHDFEFTPRSPRRISSGAKDDESDASFVEEDGDNIYFKPVIPLPDKVDVKTGEEEEEVLYCHRAKLYRFVEGEWKERGLGDIKILKRNDNGKLRVLMRREQIFKICLNHTLSSDIKYLPKDDRTWVFLAHDYSEGELTKEQFCVRFKNAEIAQEFMKAVQDALGGASGDTEKPYDQGIEAISDTDDVEFVSETKVTPEEEEEAKRLGLPPKFLSYRQLSDCECDQCKKDDEYLKDLLAKPSDVTKTSSLTQIFAPKTEFTPPTAFSASSSASSVFATPKEDSFSFKSSTSNASVASDLTLKSLLSKPSLLVTPKTSENIFSSSPMGPSANSSTVFASPTPSGVFGASKSTGSIFQSPCDLSKSASSFSFGAKPVTPQTAVATSVTESKSTGSLFGAGTNSFGGAPTTGSIFGAPKSSTGSLFSNSPLIFGGATATNTTAPSIFPNTTQTGSIFGNTPTKTGSIFNTPSTTTGSIFGGVTSGSIFGASAAVFPKTDDKNKAIVGAKANSETPATPVFGGEAKVEAKTINLKEDDAAVLDCSTGDTFASLAAKVSSDTPPAFAKDKKEPSSSSFAFLGAGAPVFASLSNSKNESTSEDVQADEEYDPHYDPIVPLPEAIVVSTGEEDEEAVFNERAKLYRYDNNTKEWKERGVGQMKILHHPDNKTYRFLLRREQVHKVVLNQLITSELELQPMTSSDTAWVWAGYNYTDDGSALEKLAIRFKNCSLAQTFYKAVQDVVDKVKQLQLERSVTAESSSQNIASSGEKVTELIPSSIQNFGEEVSTDDQGAAKAVTYDDDDDDDDDDDEDDRSVLFMKRCTLSEELNGEWKVVAMGDLQVYYDPDFYVSRICMSTDSGEVVSNTLIGMNTVMQLDQNSCVWTAVEWNSEKFRHRTLKATFSSTAAAEEFHSSYIESLNYAQEFDVVDEIPVMTEEETEP